MQKRYLFFVLIIIAMLSAGMWACSSGDDDDDTNEPLDDDAADDDSAADDDTSVDDDAADDDTSVDDDATDDDTSIDDDTSGDDDTTPTEGFDYDTWEPCTALGCATAAYSTSVATYIVQSFSAPLLGLNTPVDEALILQFAESDVPTTLPGDIDVNIDFSGKDSIASFALFYRDFELTSLTGSFDYSSAFITDTATIHIEQIGHGSGAKATVSLVNAHFVECEITQTPQGATVSPIPGGAEGTIDLVEYTDMTVLTVP